jgi:hypothetical protein
MARPRQNPSKQESIQEKLNKAQISMQRPEDDRTDQERKEAFRSYWARSKRLFNKERDVEDVLWAHLKAIKHDSEELFEEGLLNFGLKKK